MLVWSERHERLMIQWGQDHTNCLAGSVPIMALDMYEHAYHIDFGAKAGAYVDAFMKNIHWERVGARFQRIAASRPTIGVTVSAAAEDGIAAEDLLARLQRQDGLVLLDVCLAEDLAKRSDMIAGARLRAPERIADWAGELPKDKPIIAYCVYGFQVSGDVIAELRRRGFDACKLAGGIAAWHAIGAPTVPLVITEERSTP